MKHYFNVNKETWNKKVAIHAASKMYNMQAFKNGKTSLNEYELDVFKHMVKGKHLLHLQCHFGQDTLSWSRLGAKCTGIDISDKAIDLAKRLNNELNLDAEFVCCNVLDTSKYVKKQFDVVFTSYGTIGWLPNLIPWAKMIYERLKPNGVFYIVEFHPIVWMFDYLKEIPTLAYAYNQVEVIYEEYRGTYASMDANIVSKEYGWNHGLGEVVTALTKAGLHIEFLNEYDESPYNVLPNLIKTKSNMYVTKDRLYPLIFEIKAVKKNNIE